MKKRIDLIYCITLCIAFVLISCSREESTNTIEGNVVFDYKASIGDATGIADISNLVDEVKMIRLSSEVTQKIGVLFHFYVVDEVDLILVDEISKTIVRVNDKGELIWEISADKNDFRIFSEIRECAFDEFNEEVIVYNKKNEYRYDFDGRPTGSNIVPTFNFHQMFPLTAKDRMYSCQGFLNYDYMDFPRQLILTENDEFKNAYIKCLDQAPGNVFVGGFAEFNRLNDQVYYHATFRDTFYHIDLPHIYPAFTFNFSIPENTEEVMQKGYVKNKMSYSRDNGIPHLYSLAADEEKIALSYHVNRGYYLSILDRSNNEWLVNNQHLRYEDKVFQAPLLYQNGYFLQMSPQYKVDHYRKLERNAKEVSVGWTEELKQLERLDEGTDAQVIYLIKL